jgi:ribonuclease HII
MKPTEAILVPSYMFEQQAASSGSIRTAGVDEAGRGPLAGPVVAGAVVLDPSKHIGRLNDSKLLTAAVRERLYHEIMDKAVAVGVGIGSVEDIDRLNIYHATLLAMLRAIDQISPPPDFLLIDGKQKVHSKIPQKSIVKGDRLSFSIAAASIIAKVTRDRMMIEMHEIYPEYGFKQHKGYAVKAHREALCKHGRCEIHRRGFKCMPDDEPTLFDLDYSGSADL